MGGTTSCRCTKEGENNEMDLNKERDNLLIQNQELQSEKNRNALLAKAKNSQQGQVNTPISNIITSNQMLNNNNYNNSNSPTNINSKLPSNKNNIQYNQEQINQRKISNKNQSIDLNDSSNDTQIDHTNNKVNTSMNYSQPSSSNNINSNITYQQKLNDNNLTYQPSQNMPSQNYSASDMDSNNNNYANFTNAAGVINQNINRNNSMNSNPTKKFSNFNSNSIMSGSKLPLEVINEIHDIEKDSHGDGWSTNLNKLNSIPDLKNNHNSQNISQNNLYSNENEMPKFYANNERITSGEDSGSKSNSNIVEKIRDLNSNLTQNSKTVDQTSLQKSKELKSSFLKKNKPTVLTITSIIPEHRLLNSCADEVLFQTELKKLISNEGKSQNAHAYSPKFCIITNSEFRYYKSREQFLMLQKPHGIVPLHLIVEVGLFKSNPNLKKNDHIFIKLADLRDLNEIKGSLIRSVDNENINSDSTNMKSKRISQLESSNPSFRDKKKENLLNESLIQSHENLQIFSSDKEDLLQKWVVVFNYFISK